MIGINYKVHAISLFFTALLGLTACVEEVSVPKSTTPSYQIPFDKVPAVENVVLYEVNLRAYSAAGDIESVKYRLDELQEMGVNVVWLMPIYPVGQVNSVNSPYCVRNYKSVGEEYGNLSDLRDFTSAAHAKGIAVMLDWVANHTSWDHPWIDEHPDWYTQDGSGNIVHPPGTNWTDVADLNYNNLDMQAEMISSMAYWIREANVDGFRCDYADGVPYDFWVSAIDSLRQLPGRDLLFFAEGNRGDHFAAGFDMAFGWDFYASVISVFNGQAATLLQATHAYEYSGVSAGKHWVRFTTNHDESAWNATPMSLFNGKAGALAASVITVFTGGVPLIYGSQEVGTVNTVPFFYNSQINWLANSDMLEAYNKMLTFYSQNEAARIGDNTFYTTKDVVCFTKDWNGEQILVIVNVRNSNQTFNVSSNLQNIYTNVMTNTSKTLGAQISLSAYEYLILK